MKKITFTLLNVCCLLAFSSAANYENLYIVGSATNSTYSWDNGSASEFTKVSDGIFRWTGILRSKDSGDNGNARFKFLVTGKNWSPCFTCRFNVNGHQMVASGEEADIYLFTGGGYDNAFQVNSSGTYTVDVNLNSLKMVCTKISDETKDDLDHFTKETLLTSGGETLNYRKLSPINKQEGSNYPLVIFLHGAGERGSDNAAQLKYGGDLFAKKSNREAFPAYVLFPQCPATYFWAFSSQPASYTATTFPVDYPTSPAIQQVKELIDLYLEMDDVDKDRVYIAGLSMGGMGTFDIACRFPETFAAAVPICGGIHVERLEDNRLKDIYWRIFHGGADGVVTVQNSRTADATLTALGASVEYIEFPGVDHFSWTNAFAREDFLPWIFSKKRTMSTDIQSPAKEKSSNVYYKHNKLHVETEEPGTFQLHLYSIQGVLLHTFTHINTTPCQKEYDLPSLNKGVYLVEIKKDKNSRLFKICL